MLIEKRLKNAVVSILIKRIFTISVILPFYAFAPVNERKKLKHLEEDFTSQKKLDLDIAPYHFKNNPNKKLLFKPSAHPMLLPPADKKDNSKHDVKSKFTLELPLKNDECQYPTASCHLRQMFMNNPKNGFDMKDLEQPPKIRFEFNY